MTAGVSHVGGSTPGRHFQLFWAGQTISALGDAFAMVAVPLLVLEATGSVARMGLVSATGVAAQMGASVLSGAIADRVDRRRLMIACDVGRTLAYGVVPVAWWIGAGSLPLIVAVMAVGGVLGNLFQVANVAALPDLVGRERLHEANGRLAATQAFAYALGPLAAGFVVAHVGASAAIGVDAASFLVSAGSLAAISFGARPRPHGGAAANGADTAGARQAKGIAAVAAGLGYLARHPVMRAMTALLVLLGLTSNVGLSAGIVDLLVFHLKRDLGLGDCPVGVVLAVASIGAVLGATLGPRLRRRLGFGACFLGGTLLQALGLLSIGLLRSAPAAAAGSLLWAGGLLVRGIAAQSLRQTIVPPELLGRVTSAHLALALGSSALGTTLVTRAGARWGAPQAMVGIGAIAAAVALAGLFTPAARREPTED